MVATTSTTLTQKIHTEQLSVDKKQQNQVPHSVLAVYNVLMKTLPVGEASCLSPSHREDGSAQC